MATPELPEPMNSSPHHSKVNITTTLSDPTFLAGSFVSGKLNMECRADQGLGIGTLMVELFGIQEFSSRDRSATSTFLHSRRLFQGPGLPPSNAVQAHTMPGDPLLPEHYYQARRGKSTFLFRIPIPTSSPSSISFASGSAKVRYELRASADVYWKNEKTLVVDNRIVDVIQAHPHKDSLRGPPEAIVVGDNGKLWMQGRIIGGPVVAGGSACLELQVKNHSSKKNSNLTLTLTRNLYLPGQQQQPTTVQISDTLTTVLFRGPEYIIPPGAEGVANLAFDVPEHTRGVQGGILDGEGKGHGVQPRQTESLFEIRCQVQVRLSMGIDSKDIVLKIPIDVVHPMAVPQQPIPDPFIQQQQPAPYTYPKHAPLPQYTPLPQHTPYTDYASYYPNQSAYIDSSQIQPWLQTIEPPLLLPQPGPSLLPPFQPFHPIQELTNGHTPPPPHPFFPEAAPGLSYLPTVPYQIESLQPVFMNAIPPPVIQTLIPTSSSPAAANAVLHSPRPQLTPKHSFTRDPVLGYLTMSKSERVEELEKIADEVANRNRDLSGDLPKGVVAAAIREFDGKIDGDHLNLKKTLPGPQVPSGNFEGRKRVWDDGVMSKQEAENREQETWLYHPQEQQPSADGITYQTPPTPTLMAVLGPPKQTLTSESGLDALERRLLAEVGTRKPWDSNIQHNPIINEENEENVENDRRKHGMKTKAFKDHQPGKRDVRDVLLSPPSPGAIGVMLPPIHTDLHLDLVGREGVDGGGGGNGASAPIEIPMKSPDPLNESCISSLTLGGEGLASGPPDTGLGLNNDNGAALAGDSDGEGDGEADFDGKTHRAGSGSLSRGSNSGSDRIVSNARVGGGGGGFHKHMRHRAEISTRTEVIPTERVKSRRGGGGRGGGGGRVDTEKSRASSKKKERLNGTGNGTSEPKKSRNKSSAATKGRVAAWLGEIDPAIPPQEEIIPPSPSVIRDLDRLLFEDEQEAAVASLGRSPLAAAAPLYPDSDSPTTPGGALAAKTRVYAAANDGSNMDQDRVVSAPPNPRSSGFVSIATLKRDTISLPSADSVIKRPLLLSRDATVVEEARKVQDLWSSTPPGITPLDKDAPKPGGAAGAGSSLPHERKPSSSSFSKPAGAIPLSYSAAVTSAPPYPPASSGATVTPRIWKNTDRTQSISQPKGRQVPPSTSKPPVYKPPGGNLSMFPASKPPIDPEFKYGSARGGRGGRVSSVASFWASGAINNQRHNLQTVAVDSNAKDKMKEVPKRVFNGADEVPDSLPSSSSALPKPVKAEKKLFSAAVMTPAPALKNVRTYTPVASGSSGGGGGGGGPKKMTSTPALLVRSVDVLGGKAAASRSTDNVAVTQKRPAPTTTTPTTMNVFQGGKITPTANLSTSSSGPPAGKLHELAATKRDGNTKATGKAAINGPPGVMIKATSDPAVISSSHAIPTLSSTASLVMPHDRSSTGQKQRHQLQPRVAVVKLPPSTTPGSGSRPVSPRSGSPKPLPAVVDNINSSNQRKPAELAFGQARLRDLIKKYQGS